MKKLLLTAVATMVCFGVFAQGKLAFINGDNQLIFFTTDKTKMVAADANKTVNGAALAGQTLYTGAGGSIASLAGAPSIIAGLWAGTAPTNMVRVTTTTFGDINFAGFINQANVTLNGLPAGTAAWFQFQIFDASVASADEAWLQIGKYAGKSVAFQATPAAAVYAPINLTGTPVFSTMPIGTFVPTDYVGFPGYAGLIEVYATIPEPGTFALAGLGLAALLAFRRRS
jgi:hypothetical protein